LKGVKWRAYSPSTSRIAELVGAQPVNAQAAELSQALATGVIESYRSSGSTGFDTKTLEHLKYFADAQAWLPKNAVLINKAAFDALDTPTQAVLLRAGADAETRGRADLLVYGHRHLVATADGLIAHIVDFVSQRTGWRPQPHASVLTRSRGNP